MYETFLLSRLWNKYVHVQRVQRGDIILNYSFRQDGKLAIYKRIMKILPYVQTIQTHIEDGGTYVLSRTYKVLDSSQPQL